MKISIEEYYAKLMAHDWYYSFSDDGGVWSRGEESFKALAEIAKAEGGVYEAALDAFSASVNGCISGGGSGGKPSLESILATPIVPKQTHEEWLAEFTAKAGADWKRRAEHVLVDKLLTNSVKHMNNRQYWFYKPAEGSMRTVLIPADGDSRIYEVRSLELGIQRFGSWWAVVDHLQHL